MKYYPFLFRKSEAVKKQEIWRQKQIQIFYRSGKPIFTMDEETEHIRSHNNPYFYKDKYELDRPKLIFGKKRHKE
jgi:hypothetical protein